MRKVIRTVMAAIGLSACLIVLAACSREGELSEASSGELMLRVGLSLSARSSELVSEEYENKIDVAKNDYRIYFFDTKGKFIAEFTPDDFTQASDKSHEYSVTGKAPAGLATYTDFKMVVLANWGEAAYPESLNKETTIEKICTADKATFDFFSPEELKNGNKLIPFYGVRQYTGVEFKPNEFVNLEKPVELLRAVAKVEVKSVSKDWVIESVQMSHYNKKGYCAPKDVTDDTIQPNILTSTKQDLNFSFQQNENTFFIYVPEYENVSNGVKTEYAAEIQINFQNIGGNYTVEFKYYNNPPSDSKLGTAFNILRNNLYRFNVNKKKNSVEVDVYPYTQHEMEPGFGQIKTKE